MRCSRRTFISSAIGAGMTAALWPKLVFAQDGTTSGDLLVFIFIRGGWDALHVVAPVDDPNYQAARGTDTRVAENGSGKGLTLDNAFEGFDFRLHAKAAPLKELYDQGDLALIHACGVPNGTRSHFDAQSLIERGVSEDGSRRVSSGWLTRHLSCSGLNGILPVVSSTDTTPESLLGCANSCCISDIGSFAFAGHWKYAGEQQRILRRAYSGNFPLSVAGTRTLSTLDYVSRHVKKDKEGNILPYEVENGATYPRDEQEALTNSLQTIARLARMDVGLKIGLVDYDGWDTHQGQNYVLPGLLDGLSRALNAFYTDLSDYKKRITVVVMSEFGRRFRQNESYGTDHGHGSLMMVLGGNINGGKMYGTWPGLANEQLDQGVDLKVTTDYRTVLAEVVSSRLRNPQTDLVFPGFSFTPLGITRA
jgi:uncharacterized protein (DUF1501 family)